MPQISVKLTKEKFPLGFLFGPPGVEKGETITGVETSVSPDETGGLKIEGDPIKTRNTVSQMVSGGIVGKKYLLTFEVSTSGGKLLIERFSVKIMA